MLNPDETPVTTYDAHTLFDFIRPRASTLAALSTTDIVTSLGCSLSAGTRGVATDALFTPPVTKLAPKWTRVDHHRQEMEGSCKSSQRPWGKGMRLGC